MSSSEEAVVKPLLSIDARDSQELLDNDDDDDEGEEDDEMNSFSDDLLVDTISLGSRPSLASIPSLNYVSQLTSVHPSASILSSQNVMPPDLALDHPLKYTLVSRLEDEYYQSSPPSSLTTVVEEEGEQWSNRTHSSIHPRKHRLALDGGGMGFDRINDTTKCDRDRVKDTTSRDHDMIKDSTIRKCDRKQNKLGKDYNRLTNMPGKDRSLISEVPLLTNLELQTSVQESQDPQVATFTQTSVAEVYL